MNWVSGIFIIAYHALLPICLPLYLVAVGLPSSGLVITTAVLVVLCIASITAGYHRAYSHGAYKIKKSVEYIILLFGTLATQGSVLRWSFEHRLHHRFVDTNKDPYSIKKGFWYAHVLWLFDRERKIDEKVVQDLLKNKRIMFQHKYYGWLLLALNVMVIGIVGFATGDFLGAFVFGFLVRTFIVHHTTWSINSFAHTIGSKRFSKEQSAVDNWLVAFITFGEGYHNYHHTFASDYRNGIKWWQFDPTKWLVWSLAKLGLAKDLIRVNKFTIKQRLILEEKRMFIERMNTKVKQKQEQWKKIIETYAERMCTQLQTVKEIAREKRAKVIEKKQEVKKQWKAQYQLLREEWRSWKEIKKALKSLESGKHQPEALLLSLSSGTK